MKTIHAAVNDTQYVEPVQKVTAELQQGVFNDVNEIGTSKKRKRRKKNKL